MEVKAWLTGIVKAVHTKWLAHKDTPQRGYMYRPTVGYRFLGDSRVRT